MTATRPHSPAALPNSAISRIERTSNNPLAVTVAFEPNVRLIDETSGERVHNYEFETTVNADLELLRNRLYAGFNLLYEPEVTWTATGRNRAGSHVWRLGGAVASARVQCAWWAAKSGICATMTARR